MLIVANWKAYIEDSVKAKKLFTLAKRLARETEVTIVLAPPASFLSMLALHNDSDVLFAAQDISATTGGAATGENTAQAYAAAGATYALVGHSERRAFGDTDAIVATKLAHALAHGLIPILCIGEQERDGEGRYLGTLREQVTRALHALTTKERKQVIIAYEPLWAINKTAAQAIEPNDLAEIVSYIRKVLGESSLGKTSLRTRVLYGGSVEAGNARTLAAQSGIDGFLIGHASVDPVTFTQIIKELS